MRNRSGIKAFDNFRISDLHIILNKDTTTSRFYALIPVRDALTQAVISAGIHDKYAYINAYSESASDLSAITGFDIDTLTLLEHFLHQNDFINRRLSEISCVNCDFIAELISRGIKYSADYIKLYIADSPEATAHKLNAEVSDVKKLFCICDLMRLPGVKNIRAELYYDSGFIDVGSFIGQSPSRMSDIISEHIKKCNETKIVPLPKELSTQIAVAAVLPKLNI